MKVLMIMGQGRSGSTIVGSVLGELDGYFHAGELWSLWGMGLREGRLCGCGVPVSGCARWSAVVNGVKKRIPSLDVDRAIRIQRETMRVRYTRRILRAGTDWPALSEYERIVRALYEAVGEEFGCKVIVDSSKAPCHAAVLARSRSAGIRPAVLHLVRDPRAVAYSWQRTKATPGEHPGEQMLRYPAREIARNWLVINATGLLLGREQGPAYRRINYEQFATSPQAKVLEIARWIEEEAQVPDLSGSCIRLSENHTAGGNPLRLRSGITQIAPDEEWRRALAPRDRVMVSALTLPLLKSMGYSVLAGSTARAES